MNRQDIEKLGAKWSDRSPFPDPLSRFGDEKNEALMLHTKAVATQDTVYWEMACAASYDGNAMCRLGTPFPEDMTGVNETEGDEGWKFNCYGTCWSIFVFVLCVAILFIEYLSCIEWSTHVNALIVHYLFFSYRNSQSQDR